MRMQAVLVSSDSLFACCSDGAAASAQMNVESRFMTFRQLSPKLMHGQRNFFLAALAGGLRVSPRHSGTACAHVVPREASLLVVSKTASFS